MDDNDFIFYPFTDSAHNDFFRMDFGTIEECKKFCLSQSHIVGFNTFGFYKVCLNPKKEWIQLGGMSKYGVQGLFVKKSYFIPLSFPLKAWEDWLDDLQKRVRFSKVFQNIPDHSDRMALIVEPRKHPYFSYVLHNFMYILAPKGWNLGIYHGTENKEFVMDLVKEWKGGIYLYDIGVSNLNLAEYSKLLNGKEFYQRLPSETKHVLIFQTDTILLKDNMDDFLPYDYLGAPWSFNPNGIGNGGLSLRNKDKMIEICGMGVADGSNEDGWFDRYRHLMKIPDFETKKRFSVETIWCDECTGMHCAYKYIDHPTLEAHLKSHFIKQVIPLDTPQRGSPLSVGNKIHFTHFGKKFSPFVVNYFKDKFVETDFENADIVIYHFLDHVFPPTKAVRVLVSGESSSTKDSFDLAISTIPDMNAKITIYFPMLYQMFSNKKMGWPTEIPTKTKFCAYLYYMSYSHRIQYFHLISRIKPVDGLGRCCNTIPHPLTRFNEEEYLDIAMQLYFPYKFMLAIENNDVPGYFTEKLMNGLMGMCIPIYWGNQEIFQYINKERVINIMDYTEEGLLQRIRYLDENEDAFMEMVKKPWFLPGKDYKIIYDNFSKIMKQLFPGQ